MSIGTAKPTPEEMQRVKHYFIDSHSITDEVTSARFEVEALGILEEEFKTNDVIVLTGGSGMFVDALCIGLDPIPSSPEIRKTVQQEFDENGLSPLLDELKSKDPEYYDRVDRANPARILRAIEVIRLTGTTYSEQRKSTPAKRPFKVTRFVIEHERPVLYERINLRVDLMIKEGLVEEVKSLEQYRNQTSMNTVGYKELFEHFDGTISMDEAVEKIKQNTRRYAKRQITWLKRHPESIWLKHNDNQTLVQQILMYLSES